MVKIYLGQGIGLKLNYLKKENIKSKTNKKMKY